MECRQGAYASCRIFLTIMIRFIKKTESIHSLYIDEMAILGYCIFNKYDE